MATPNERVLPELDPRRGILQLVSAFGAAQKLKHVSLGLRLQRSRQRDVGSFDITHSDRPHSYEDEFDQGVLPAAKQPRKVRAPSTVESSVATIFAGRPEQNTYRLEPSRTFDERKVGEIIRKTFEEHLAGQSYSPDFGNEISRLLADSIKDRVKALRFSRCKIISLVNISQKEGQRVRLVSRCVWDSKRDNYAQYSMESGDLFATGIVYGVYQD